MTENYRQLTAVHVGYAPTLAERIEKHGSIAEILDPLEYVIVEGEHSGDPFTSEQLEPFWGRKLRVTIMIEVLE